MNGNTSVQAPTPRAIPFARATSHVALQRHRRIHARVADSVRTQVAAAFRSLANGVDTSTAAVRVNAFYRATGLAWARCLG